MKPFSHAGVISTTFLLLLGLNLLFPSIAKANSYSCKPIGFYGHVYAADLVFTGKVLNQVGNLTTMQVDKTYKGNATSTVVLGIPIEVLKKRPAIYEEYKFAIGESYLVFADLIYGYPIATYPCSETKRLANAQEDIKKLEHQNALTNMLGRVDATLPPSALLLTLFFLLLFVLGLFGFIAGCICWIYRVKRHKSIKKAKRLTIISLIIGVGVFIFFVVVKLAGAIYGWELPIPD